MRSRDIDAEDGTMESDSKKCDFEPPSKRFKANSGRQDAASVSNVADEALETGGADLGGTSNTDNPELIQMKKVDHQSDGSADTDNISVLSDLSDFELNDQSDETSWQPVAGPISWVQRQMSLGVDPRDILRKYIGDDQEIPPELDQIQLWNIIISMMIEPQPRKKLPNVNTLDDVINLLRKCENIMVLTGAGVSVSCGIPDFRSRNGIYARLAKDFPNLPDPQAMFSIDFFKSDQRPFFKFAKEIYPGLFTPSPCHNFIKLLESQGKLLRNYTQNIDTLEKVAGIEHVIECHGSFATATCMVCKYNVDAEAIREDIFNQVIPRCPHCGPEEERAVMKPDIVFFGESLPQKFHKQMAADKDICDLLIVIGSSLKVRPVALIPNSIPENVPQIIINREPLNRRLNFDVELLGNCDDIISELCKRLGAGWDHLAQSGPPADEVHYLDLPSVSLMPSVSLPEVSTKGGEEIIEHSADSGLGDFDAVTSAESVVKPRSQMSHSNSNLASGSDTLHATNNDRLQRLSSSDSGAESSTTPDVHKSMDFAVTSQSSDQSQTEASLEPCSGDAVSSSELISQEGLQGHDNDCTEVTAQGDCACSGSQQNGMSNHSHYLADSSQKSQVSEVHTESAHHSAHSSRPARHKKTSFSEGQPRHSGHSSHSHSQNSEDGEKIDLDRESKKDNTHCSHTDTIEEMRQLWVPRTRLSIASRMNENQIIFMPPNRYLFRGAEVYSDDSDDSETSDSDESTPPQSPVTEEHAEPDEFKTASSSPSTSPPHAAECENMSGN